MEPAQAVSHRAVNYLQTQCAFALDCADHMNPEPGQITVSPDYETKLQVARRLNVSRRTIDNLMRQRRLPSLNSRRSPLIKTPKACAVNLNPAHIRRLTIHGGFTNVSFR
jgi:hypothetical protein